MQDIILIHSPLVGPSSMTPTAEALETEHGVRCQVPTPDCQRSNLPSWRDWPAALLKDLPSTIHPVIVGHSMGGLLAARLASDLGAAGMICLDANMPPERGVTPTVEPSFNDFLKTLPTEDGVLPPWHLWWQGDIFEGSGIKPDLHATFLNELPQFQLDWFADAFEMPDWSSTKRAFLRTSSVFVEEANRAKARGWPVVKLKGTHLHPMLEPDETAQAIIKCCKLMGLG